MGYRYNLNDRILGGSMDPRLNPDCVDTRLNVKLRPTWPSPMVRETSTGSIHERGNAARRAAIGLNSKFDRKG